MKKKLTPKQRKFAEEYVNTGNASEAYRRAYDVGKNTSIDTIKVNSSKMLADTNISLTIKELQIKQANKYEITRKEVAEGYFKMIKSWEYLMDLASKENLTKEQKSKFYLLKEMVKGSDYRGAYDSIAKMFGLNAPDKQEIEQTVHNININIKRGSD
jgi:phage terminase small subunit|tara:strand:- start:10991 stop:11461 length:471 start_codon:yes stop_codon:yes gene_type:complete